MLIPLDDRNNGHDFCVAYPEWRNHPFYMAHQLQLGFPKKQPTLELIGNNFGPCTTAHQWQDYRPVLGLLALRESTEPYCRRILVLEVRAADANGLYECMRGLRSDDHTTMVGTLMQICMARFEDEQPPPVVRWQATVPARVPDLPTDVFVLGHVNFRQREQWLPVSKRIRGAKILPPTHGNGIICDGSPLVGFADLWDAARISD